MPSDRLERTGTPTPACCMYYGNRVTGSCCFAKKNAYVCAVRMYVCLRWHTAWFSVDFYRSFGDAVRVVIGCLLFACLLVVDAYVHVFTSHLPSDRSRVMVALREGITNGLLSLIFSKMIWYSLG